MNGIEILASASITAATGAIVAGRGILSAANAGAGIVNITLPPTGGVDASECVILCSPRNALAASSLVSYGVAHTSDTVKAITIFQEQAAGAASIAANVDFDILIIKFPNG